jgi:hypothetical protein
MTEEQLAEEMFPGMILEKAPQWVRDLLDFLWNLFSKK